MTMNAVRVLSTLAVKGAVPALAARYQAQGGARIEADFAPTLALLDRLRRGETADVVILTREGLDELARAGSVVRATCVDLARSYGYADSHSDLPLLAAVGNPVAVRPDVSLYRHAKKAHWPIADWASPDATARSLNPAGAAR